MTTSDTLKLQYVATAIQPPVGALRAWGARAIMRSPEFIDLLFDRQDIQPDEPRLSDPACPEGKRAFASWVDNVGMPWLRNHVKRVWLSGRDSTIVAHIEGQYAIVATPNASYGYLYICAWELPMGMAHPVDDTPTPAPPPEPEKHEFKLTSDRFNRRFGLCECEALKSDPIHKVRRTRRA